jgi:hypothetical protein
MQVDAPERPVAAGPHDGALADLDGPDAPVGLDSDP